MPTPIQGKHYRTQEYGLTAYARSSGAYKNFPGGIHPGIDFGTGGINLPAISTCKGKVVAAGINGGWGNMVEVQGADGWRRQYAHLQSIAVETGELVEVGQELGRVGTTGASTGIHLHWGHRRRKALGGWEYRDPSPELIDTAIEVPKVIKKKLIKGKGRPDVFIYAGERKFPIPDWSTKVFLFGEKADDIEEIELDQLAKIPEGSIIPSLK